MHPTTYKISTDLSTSLPFSLPSTTDQDIRYIEFHRRQKRYRFHTICRSRRKTASLYDLSQRHIPYDQAWAWQKQLVKRSIASTESTTIDNEDLNEEKVREEEGEQYGTDAVILLQHEPVYTLGTGSTEDHLLFDLNSSPLPVYRTERGGEVTYHGPGQLVMYPILNLKLYQQDLHWYLRSLEEIIIQALDQVSGIKGQRVHGLTGVWVDGKKVAAIGVRATRWVSFHGLALNITTDLSPFGDIVPCGISDRPVTSVAELLIEQQLLNDPYANKHDLRHHMIGCDHHNEQLLEEYKYGLMAAMEDVLGLTWSHVFHGEDALKELQHQMEVV